jgi:hypothetical protein
MIAGLYARSECAEIVTNLIVSRALARKRLGTAVVLDSCWTCQRCEIARGLDDPGRPLHCLVIARSSSFMKVLDRE